MTELKIVYKPFATLVPDPRNSNTHPEEQVAQIAASIKKFGFNGAILIDENNQIIAGEGRYLAVKYLAAKEGYRKKVPTITLSHLTEVQRRAFLIADNRIARNSTWDLEKLGKELADLRFVKYDLNLELGFNSDELADLLAASEAITNQVVESIVPVGSHTRTIRHHNDEQPAERSGKGKTRQLGVLVYCKDAEHQEEVFKQLQAAGLHCTNTVI